MLSATPPTPKPSMGKAVEFPCFRIAIRWHFTLIIYCTIFPLKIKAFLGDFYKKIKPFPAKRRRISSKYCNTNIYTLFFNLLHKKVVFLLYFFFSAAIWIKVPQCNRKNQTPNKKTERFSHSVSYSLHTYPIKFSQACAIFPPRLPQKEFSLYPTEDRAKRR